ncbi:MAG: hypothetical protein DYH05_03975 [Acidobacteria bacterium ACB1]|nr:hypothetical protein [Pyrinomonadaceae bacterium]MCE7961637.1 hypothetical protein [Acidobacteria bacterium ACB1]RIJ96763.1 MAG: hypothetical protein DCC44_00085 [Acidobacteriota bacterium]
MLEIYSVLLAVFWAERQSMSKLIKLTTSSFDELQHPDDKAYLDMGTLPASSVEDLDKLARFHDLKIGSGFGDKSYNGTKAELIRNVIADQRKKRAEEKK